MPEKSHAGAFKLELPVDIRGNTVSRAYLTIRKKHDSSDHQHNQTLVLYELKQNSDGSIPPQTGKSLRHHASITTDVKEGWIKVDVTATIRHWAIHWEYDQRVLQVVCKTCSDTDSPIYLTEDSESMPYLTIDYKHRDLERRRRPRNKRSHSDNCRGGNCCLRQLYVNMHEDQEDRWIIQPEGFNANYCDGSCSVRVRSSKYYTTSLNT